MNRRTKLLGLTTIIAIIALLIFFYPKLSGIIFNSNIEYESENYIIELEPHNNAIVKVFQSMASEHTYTIRTENKQVRKHHIFLKDFVNDPTKPVSFDFSYIADNKRQNIIVGIVNDSSIKELNYVDHAGAMAVISQPQADNITLNSTQIEQHPQFWYISNGFDKGTFIGKDEHGNIVFEEEFSIN